MVMQPELALFASFIYDGFQDCGDGISPCNPSGVSPFMHTDRARFTSPLVTVRNTPGRPLYGVNSVNLKGAYQVISRRVERSRPERFSKVCRRRFTPQPGAWHE